MLKEKYTIKYIKENGLVLFECLTGSHAYGTAVEGRSDRDIKGVFMLEQDDYFGLDYLDEVSDQKQDQKYFELKKFMNLLITNNPNILEMLNMPDDCILSEHPLYDLLDKNTFLSKLCRETFGNYAIQQIKKARGLNKKIVNPMPLEKKSILDFCFVLKGMGSVTLKKWLMENNYRQEYCGLSKIDQMRDIYNIYYDHQAAKENRYVSTIFKGILKDESHTQLLLSSVPREYIADKAGLLYYNADAYNHYLKDYHNYISWLRERNEDRYNDAAGHGKGYDGKNLGHCFRLIDMAEEIATLHKIIVRRPDREKLLAIRRGEFEYDELVTEAESKLKNLEKLYEESTLPDCPDKETVNRLHIMIRKKFYNL